MAAKNFFMVPNGFEEMLPYLTPKEVASYLVLARIRNSKTNECHPAEKTIAKRSGYDKERVKDAIQLLESKGAIKVERKPGRINSYKLTSGGIRPHLLKQVGAEIDKTGGDKQQVVGAINENSGGDICPTHIMNNTKNYTENYTRNYTKKENSNEFKLPAIIHGPTGREVSVDEIERAINNKIPNRSLSHSSTIPEKEEKLPVSTPEQIVSPIVAPRETRLPTVAPLPISLPVSTPIPQGLQSTNGKLYYNEAMSKYPDGYKYDSADGDSYWVYEICRKEVFSLGRDKRKEAFALAREMGYL